MAYAGWGVMENPLRSVNHTYIGSLKSKGQVSNLKTLGFVVVQSFGKMYLLAHKKTDKKCMAF